MPLPVDTCAPESCAMPDTVCVDLEGGGFECRCRPGTRLEGGMCAVPTRCEADTCGTHGTCDDTSGVVACTCDAGWAGEACERCADGLHDDGAGGCTDDVCLPDPCPIDRECVPAGGEATCACPAGLHDEGGACVPDTTCGERTCSGAGSCEEREGRVFCTCDEGFTGTFCDACDEGAGYHDDGAGGCTTDPCVPSPCTAPRRSVCTADDLGGTSCGCDPGSHDELGECVPDEVCEATSCGAHGTCSIVGGLVACACDAGWAGAGCDACDAAGGYHDDGAGGCTTDACLPNPCTTVPNRSVCTATGAGHTCACDAGHHDDGVGGCTTDVCVPDPCAAMGMACRDGGGAAECYTPVCDDGNPCTTDAFNGSACAFTPRANGSACSTTLCSSGQTCTAGACGGGAVVSCDDGNPCTADSCDAITGCAHVASDAIVPDDGVACTVDACSGGVAGHTPSHARCDDASWCTGVETCAPGAAGADAMGCVTSARPVAPGTDGACGAWACDDATETFALVPSAPGSACDDGIGCTSGDACTGSGACAGTVSGDCAACTTGGAPGDVDLAPAHVSGTIVFAGGALPARSRSTTNIGIWLRARDTGAQQLLEVISFSSSWDGTGYPLASFSTRDDRAIDLPVLPGVYDVVYRRYSSGDGTFVSSHEQTDPYAFGNQVLAEGVVIGPGENVLDVDVAPGRVTGTLTFGGGALPARSGGSTNIGVWLRSHETGSQQLLEIVSFGSWDGLGYPLASFSTRDDRALDLPVLPGTYDIVYRRYSSGDGTFVSSHEQTDPYAFGNQVLRRDVVIGTGTTALTIDLAPVRVTGTMTFGGGALPARSRSTTNIGVWLRSHETGSQQLLEIVSFSSSWDGMGYPLATFSTRDDRAIDLPVLAGTYDVVYRRYSSGDGSFVSSHEQTDPYAFGNQVLRRAVVIGPGATTLDVDLAPVRVTGTLTFDGGALPARSRSTTNIGVWLRSHDTGAQQLLEIVSFSSSWDGMGYPLATFSTRDDRVVDLPVLPGTYDVIYRRYSSGDGSFVSSHEQTDPYAFGNQLLRRDVVIGPGATTLDVDLAPVRVTGTLTFDGGALPARSRSTTNIGVWLRSHETGSQQLLEIVSFSSSWDGMGYPLATFSTRDDRAIDLPVLPGTYDVIYRRYSSGDGSFVSSHEPTDAYAFGNQLLRSGVVVAAGMGALDLDLAPTRVGGSLVWDGGALPARSRSTTNIGVWLRSHDTGAQQLLEIVSFSSSWDGMGYPLATFSTRDDRVVDLPVLPGTYDVVYRRYSSGDGTFVSSHEQTDPYAFGNRFLGACVTVP